MTTGARQATQEVFAGLASRSEFDQRLDRALEGHQRHGRPMAVLLVDVETPLSAGVSDGAAKAGAPVEFPEPDLRRIVVDRILGTTRVADCVTQREANRYAVLLPEIARADHAELVGIKILEALSVPIRNDGRPSKPVLLQVSIGAAAVPGVQGPDLLGAAKAALSASRRADGGVVMSFQTGMRAAAEAEASLAEELAKGLIRDELRLHYQPIFSLPDRDLVGLEALVRWQHPAKGLLLPEDFFPAAIEGGLAGSIDSWALREAMTTTQHWLAETPGRRVSVNMSRLRLCNPSVVDEIEDLLNELGMQSSLLEVEVSERELLGHRAESVLEQMSAITDLGVGLAFDDFGVGFASIAQLRSFQGERLKIDVEFVARLGNERETGIVKGIIDLAKYLDLTTVAEGVETNEQLETLIALGCDEAQGHLLGSPKGTLPLNAGSSKYRLL